MCLLIWCSYNITGQVSALTLRADMPCYNTWRVSGFFTTCQILQPDWTQQTPSVSSVSILAQTPTLPKHGDVILERSLT